MGKTKIVKTMSNKNNYISQLMYKRRAIYYKKKYILCDLIKALNFFF